MKTPTKISYVNGRYSPHILACEHIDDRAAQFGDGAYEVMLFRKERSAVIFEEEAHLKRLEYSLSQLSITPPCSRASLMHIMREVIRRSPLREGAIYLQVSRAIASRVHNFPPSGEATLVVTLHPARKIPPSWVEEGARAVSLPDIRWNRCDIKSLNLLANVMGKEHAKRSGAAECLFYRPYGEVVPVGEEGVVPMARAADSAVFTEGGASNLFIIADGVIYTHPANTQILHGVTRAIAVQLASEMRMEVREEAYPHARLSEASEMFITSTTLGIMPITKLDGDNIGDGKVGSISRELVDAYNKYANLCMMKI